MSWSALGRARRFGHSPTSWRLVLLLSAASALLVPLLIIDLGLIVHLLVSRGGGGEAQNDWILGLLVGGDVLDWPLLGKYESCLLLLVGVGALLALLEAGVLWWLTLAVHRLALRVATRLRAAIHTQAFQLGTHDLLGTARSSPEELFANHVERVRQGLVAWYRAAPSSWVALALLLLLAAAVNVWIALFAVSLSACIARLYRKWKRRQEERGLGWQERAAEQRAKLLRTLSLAPMTTGYGLEEPPGAPFHTALREFEHLELRAATSSAAIAPLLLLTTLWSVGLLLVVIGLSSDLTLAGTVLLGTALTCSFFPAYRLYRLRLPLDEAEKAATEIFAYLEREPGVGQVADARPLDRLEREVKLDRITLADRNGHRLLDQISLVIPAGQRVAVLASDPQTPIALAGLFVRFYDPAAGRILFDDHDIRHATLDTVRGQALLVAERGPLFPGTVSENIACGDLGFTRLQIIDAARKAQAYEFIRSLPQSFDTRVGEHPSHVSGDQAFRIGLARALLREPSLLVIEEPTCPVDERTLSELDKAILQAAEGRTVVLLPSLPSTLRLADHVFVFHEGKLNASGEHTDLLKTSELYRHINYVRFNAFRQKVKW